MRVRKRTRTQIKSDIKLINLIKKYPQIYDIKKSRNKETRTLSWKQISEQMQIPVKNCKKKWFTLYTAYKKALEDQAAGKHIDGVLYENELRFFQKYIPNYNNVNRNNTTRNMPSTANYQPSAPPFEQVVDVQHQSSPFQNMPQSQSSASPYEQQLPQSSEPFQNMPQSQNESVVYQNMPQFFEHRVQQSPLTHHEPAMHQNNHNLPPCYEPVTQQQSVFHEEVDDSPIVKFFIAMANTVKTLPPLLQARVKNEVFASVNSAEMLYLEEEQQNKNNSSSKYR